jgi:chitinase
MTDVTSYSYDSSKKEFVSYDTPNIVKKKAQYVQTKGFAGSMFWELSTDKVGADSLVGTSHSVYGTLDQTQNHISYPNSKYDNLRNNFGQGGGSNPGTTVTPTTTPTPTTTKTTTTPTSSPTGGSGSCAGVGAWSSAIAYTGGQTATYGGHLWTAKWWTQNDTPGGAAGVWTDNGAC